MYSTGFYIEKLKVATYCTLLYYSYLSFLGKTNCTTPNICSHMQSVQLVIPTFCVSDRHEWRKWVLTRTSCYALQFGLPLQIWGWCAFNSDCETHHIKVQSKFQISIEFVIDWISYNNNFILIGVTLLLYYSIYNIYILPCENMVQTHIWRISCQRYLSSSRHHLLDST